MLRHLLTMGLTREGGRVYCVFLCALLFVCVLAGVTPCGQSVAREGGCSLFLSCLLCCPLVLYVAVCFCVPLFAVWITNPELFGVRLVVASVTKLTEVFIRYHGCQEPLELRFQPDYGAALRGVSWWLWFKPKSRGERKFGVELHLFNRVP